MEVLYGVFSWGSPVGLSLFAFFSAAGAGILFWGISCLRASGQQEKSK